MYSNAHLQNIIEGLVLELRQKEAEILSLKHQKFAQFNNEECWIYQGNGDDHLESLVCPVVISAHNLQQLIDTANGNKQIQPVRDRFTV